MREQDDGLEDCPDCSATGVIPCDVCPPGAARIECEECDGDGEVVCDLCGGGGLRERIPSPLRH